MQAGTQRRRETNIGVDPSAIGVRCAEALADARFWAAESVFEADALAARVHTRPVDIHPFPNGNGRCTRLVAYLNLISTNHPAFGWGSDTLDRDGATRGWYLGGLVHAVDTDDFAPLLDFARS